MATQIFADSLSDEVNQGHTSSTLSESASSKTRIGELKQGFHFLGVNFEEMLPPQGEIQETKVKVHTRTCSRDLDNVVALRSNAVNPAKIQSYLSRLAA